jgi:hypothetical protein
VLKQRAPQGVPSRDRFHDARGLGAHARRARHAHPRRVGRALLPLLRAPLRSCPLFPAGLTPACPAHQLEVFISSIGNITAEQSASVGLAFATTVYIYASSHIVVRHTPSVPPQPTLTTYHLLSSPFPSRALQGIYPTIIVILVHFQKSYIGDATAHTAVTSIAFSSVVRRSAGTHEHELGSLSLSSGGTSGGTASVSVGSRGTPSVAAKRAAAFGDSEVAHVTFADVDTARSEEPSKSTFADEPHGLQMV